MSAQARELDDALLAIVADWRRGGAGCDEHRFDERARATFAHQIENNRPYARYVATLAPQRRTPATWRDIPGVPADAFKDASLATFDVAYAQCEFHTSGTTAERSGKHFVERAALYDAVLLAGFDRFMLDDGARLRYLNLVPNPRLRPHSSLGYMMGHVGVLRGDGKAQYFLEDDTIDVAGFVRAFESAVREDVPLCIAGTAFAFVTLIDALRSDGRRLSAPPGSRVMETGGFKGRSRVVPRDELYAGIAGVLGIAASRIVAEYGMTELLSQYYDAPQTRAQATRVKVAPPWLRTLVIGPDGREVPRGDTGTLRHVDLANRSSVIAIDTADRGYAQGDGIVLLGRDAEAPLRGCSLDAEELSLR